MPLHTNIDTRLAHHTFVFSYWDPKTTTGTHHDTVSTAHSSSRSPRRSPSARAVHSTGRYGGKHSYILHPFSMFALLCTNEGGRPGHARFSVKVDLPKASRPLWWP